MNVAVMYSGGKDSNYAVQYALEKGWNVRYLLSVKPTRTDCYLFHFATVEHTPLQAEALGLKHYLLSCSVADPKKEAAIVEKFVAEKQKSAAERVEAVILGGTGLQATQIRSIQEALMPYGVEVFAAHSGEDHETVFRKMLEEGFEIVVTQVAAEGAPKWLGKTITKQNFEELKKDSERYGFHLGFEGGHADTFVVDAPMFKKRILVEKTERVMEGAYSGHVVIKKPGLANKPAVVGKAALA
ncbi:diphthine--ammonia ligase [Candidatus Woesearchaeota archaeon]|nr:diphthine--ammonia ligase [Candidatus Woesearchaeota archaeon]